MSDIPTIKSTYGGEQFVPLPPRHDPTPEERERARIADMISYPDVLKTFAWTAADLEQAQSKYGFPKKLGDVDGGWGRGQETQFSRTAIRAWQADGQRFVSTAFAVKVR